MTEPQVTAVLETRLIHDVHRQASSLLIEAAARPAAPAAALADLRDFLVAHLHHHHESEDDILWPMIVAKSPEAAEPLAGLTAEHHRLDTALAVLSAAPTDGDAGRAALKDAAATVRDVIHLHLEHEEAALFPALRDHVSDEAWADFSRQVIMTTPEVGMHLLVGFLEQVGTPEEVEILLGAMPAPVRTALHEQAQATFASLR
jgi:hemerythrin-like domain-containing protein